MKDDKPHKNGLGAKTFAVIALAVLIGLGACFCVIFATERRWVEFAVSLTITVVLFIITSPLAYDGDTYECPKCGNKFKVNPYVVLFTNGRLKTMDCDGTQTKCAKLKCPNCKTKGWCKRRWKQL